MKLYYKDKGYPVVWKSQMKSNMWYSMEPVKLHVVMPISVYKEIYNFFIKEINSDGSDMSVLHQQDNTINFQIHVSETDKINSRVIEQDRHKQGLWDLECFIISASFSSKFKNESVMAIFDVNVMNCDFIIDKSILRDLLLNELV